MPNLIKTTLSAHGGGEGMWHHQKSDSKVMKHRQLKKGIIQPGINDSNEDK
jgi:hypothetical protein